MSEELNTVGIKAGKCMLHKWLEERAVAALDTQETMTQIQKQGHSGIFTMDLESKMDTVTMQRTTYVPPTSPGVRPRGIRAELLERNLTQMIREKVQAELKPPSPKTDLLNYISTTQRDFRAEGFVPVTPEPTQVCDYRTDQAITFWSENRQQIQGVTTARTLKAPFGKSAQFSTPISERLDEMELPPDN